MSINICVCVYLSLSLCMYLSLSLKICMCISSETLSVFQVCVFFLQKMPTDQQDQPAEAEQCPLQFREHHESLHSTDLSPDTETTFTFHVYPVSP